VPIRGPQPLHYFPSKQNRDADSFVATGLTGAEMAAASKTAALKGMEEMRRVFKETGSELFRGAGRREHH